MNKNLNHAKELRRNQTDAEKFLWEKLRSRTLDGFKFRRQVPLGTYILDFVCFEARLIIELDGGQHAETASQTYDAERDNWLRSQGFRIVRFWNHQIFTEWDVIEEHLWKLLRESPSEPSALEMSSVGVKAHPPHPNPLPPGERGQY